ncbi:MAG: helix-turn-helix domain-containing protein [Pseudomonadota bacterium]
MTHISTATQSASSQIEARFLSNSAAADLLSLSPRTLEKYRVIGGGPVFRKFGRRVLYAREDLESWARARCWDTTSAVSAGRPHAK